MMKAHRWHDAVFARTGGRCEALQHDRLCAGMAQVAHHIVYRSHLHSSAYWIIENGAALSQYCHLLAHATHNQNLPQRRLKESVDAVNKAHRALGFPERPYFAPKAA